MYGGGFATVPAYLADLFGTQMVGAIHGRLLTAWSTAGILGPVVVNYMRDYQLGLGIPREQVYNQTMYILVGMLVIGLICNLLVRPVAAKYFMTDEELAERTPPRARTRRGRRGRRRGGAASDARSSPLIGGAGLGGRRHPARVGRLHDARQCREVLQLTTCGACPAARHRAAPAGPAASARERELLAQALARHLPDVPAEVPGGSASALLPILHHVQDALGFVPPAAACPRSPRR